MDGRETGAVDWCRLAAAAAAASFAGGATLTTLSLLCGLNPSLQIVRTDELFRSLAPYSHKFLRIGVDASLSFELVCASQTFSPARFFSTSAHSRHHGRRPFFNEKPCCVFCLFAAPL